MQDRKRDTNVQNRLLDSVEEGEGGMFPENSFETCILSRVKQITSPGWMHETSAQAWCTGKTQRDRLGSEVGGGIWMGNTCKSMADSFQCMTKPTTILQSNQPQSNFKKPQFWTFLLVQWFRICLPMQGTWVRSLVQEDSTYPGATKPVPHNY